MNLASAGFVLACLLAVIVAACLVARTASADAGRRSRLRAGLLEQIRGLRLHRMLRYRGIDLVRYLYGERIVDIKTNISRCRRCENLEECDRVLADDTHATEDFSFCPNCGHLARLAAGVPQEIPVHQA